MPERYFVTGATGHQGGAVARALLSAGYSVHAITRSLTSPAALALKSLGASFFLGDFDDTRALHDAAAGCTGLFLNVSPAYDPATHTIKEGAEERYAHNILTAARSAGVRHVVVSTAAGIDQHSVWSGPEVLDFLKQYHDSKWAVEEAVRNGGFKTWTVLRPGTLMSNFILPHVAFMFPELGTQGILLSAYTPEYKLGLFAAADVGKFVVAAFEEPGRFGGKEINLTSEELTMEEIAAVLTDVSGKLITANFRGEEEVRELRDKHPIVGSQRFMAEAHYKMSLGEAAIWGIPLLTTREFFQQEKRMVDETLKALPSI